MKAKELVFDLSADAVSPEVYSSRVDQ